MTETVTTRKKINRLFYKTSRGSFFPQVLTHFPEFYSFQWVVCPLFFLHWIPLTWSLGHKLCQGTLPSWSCTAWSLGEVYPSPRGQDQSLQEMTYMPGSRAGFSWSSLLGTRSHSLLLPTLESLHQPKPPSNSWHRNAKFCLTNVIY